MRTIQKPRSPYLGVGDRQERAIADTTRIAAGTVAHHESYPDPHLFLQRESHAVYGESLAAGQTTVQLSPDGGALVADAPGVPVAVAMLARYVAVSFMAGSVPSGPWIATLWRRPVGGTFAVASTFQFATS